MVEPQRGHPCLKRLTFFTSGPQIVAGEDRDGLQAQKLNDRTVFRDSPNLECSCPPLCGGPKGAPECQAWQSLCAGILWRLITTNEKGSTTSSEKLLVTSS